MKAWDFSFDALDGSPLPLERFKGEALLVVNTASRCGFTPQYEGLQQLYEQRSPEGLAILGVPSNDFGAQEPGSEVEIEAFCSTKFHVGFPMTAKNIVVGPEAHPFYRWLVSEKGADAAPRWNFHKVLVGRDGRVAGVFSSRVAPESPELTAAITAALAIPPET